VGDRDAKPANSSASGEHIRVLSNAIETHFVLHPNDYSATPAKVTARHRVSALSSHDFYTDGGDQGGIHLLTGDRPIRRGGRHTVFSSWRFVSQLDGHTQVPIQNQSTPSGVSRPTLDDAGLAAPTRTGRPS
jgi:hypothetical protein